MGLLSKFNKSAELRTEYRDISFETVFIDLKGEISNKVTSECRILRQHLPDDVYLDLALIPAGSFLMGNHLPGGYKDEKPQHYVHLNSFFMSVTGITQHQWKAVMGKLPPCRGKTLDHPVDRVSWIDAGNFCTKISRLTDKMYRLPSESEWEYACRAGSSAAFCYGNMITTDFCNYVGAHSYKGGPEGVYRHGPVPPGQFPPNKYGLYDMHGNLWEWCQDSWHDSYDGSPVDGEAWLNGGTEERVLRGGSWHDPPDLCRSSCRLKLMPSEGEDYTGVRIALTFK